MIIPFEIVGDRVQQPGIDKSFKMDPSSERARKNFGPFYPPGRHKNAIPCSENISKNVFLNTEKIRAKTI